MAGINDILGAGGPVDVQKLLGPVLEMVQSAPGGVQGLIGQLQGSGLGEQVSSWLGTGDNASVDPAKLASALGPEQVQALAAKAGVPVEQAQSALSSLLPTVIDKLSPGGSIPGADQLAELAKKIPGAESVTGLLGGLLGGSTPPAQG